MSDARTDILGRIRSALGASEQSRVEDYRAIARPYRQTGTTTAAERLELFADRLLDYGAAVYHCSLAQIPEFIAQAVRKHGKTSLLAASGIPRDWLPPTIEFIAGDGLSYEQMDAAEGVLTGCALAIAFTGTIVLRHTTQEGNRAMTLIPDYHLCVVRSEQIVETVVEGIREMASFGNDPVTTISGPSATSDIEMTRIKGVHGPRMLDVILVSAD